MTVACRRRLRTVLQKPSRQSCLAIQIEDIVNTQENTKRLMAISWKPGQIHRDVRKCDRFHPNVFLRSWAIIIIYDCLKRVTYKGSPPQAAGYFITAHPLLFLHAASGEESSPKGIERIAWILLNRVLFNNARCLQIFKKT